MNEIRATSTASTARREQASAASENVHAVNGGTRAAFDARYHTFARREGWFDPDQRARTVASLARVLAPHLPAGRDAAILDVGCGEGALLTLLRREGYRSLAAFDLSPENVTLCHEQGFSFVLRHDALEVGTFAAGHDYDVVFALDLLEHLPKERALGFVRAARARLRPGGRLVIQTPNMGSVLGPLYRHADITHEWGVTEGSIVDLLTAAGFDPADVSVGPAWSATTARGRVRERYLRLLHRIVFLAEGSARPRIPTPNLLAVAVAR